jgi:hypothetical protein
VTQRETQNDKNYYSIDFFQKCQQEKETKHNALNKKQTSHRMDEPASPQNVTPHAIPIELEIFSEPSLSWISKAARTTRSASSVLRVNNKRGTNVN